MPTKQRVIATVQGNLVIGVHDLGQGFAAGLRYEDEAGIPLAEDPNASPLRVKQEAVLRQQRQIVVGPTAPADCR